MSDRRGVVVQVAEEAYRKQAGGSRARLVDGDDLEALLDELARYGPEPVGFVIELHEDGVDDVPDGFAVRSRWWLTPGEKEIVDCPECGEPMLPDTHPNHSELDNWWCPRCEVLLDENQERVELDDAE